MKIKTCKICETEITNGYLCCKCKDERKTIRDRWKRFITGESTKEKWDNFDARSEYDLADKYDLLSDFSKVIDFIDDKDTSPIFEKNLYLLTLKLESEESFEKKTEYILFDLWDRDSIEFAKQENKSADIKTRAAELFFNMVHTGSF